MTDKALTAKQAAALQKLKENISDIIQDSHDDAYLLRWLKARDFDVTKAEAMYRKSMAWRQEIGADTLVDQWEAPEVLRKYYPGGYHGGHDKEGYPIRITLPASGDLIGMAHSCPVEDIVKYEAMQLEKGVHMQQENTKQFGKTIDQVTAVIDLCDLGLKNLAPASISVMNTVVEMEEANYPENLHTLYMINAPRLFPIIYGLVKPFLAESTKNKMQIFGADWKEKLLEFIDADQLPVQWGGTMTDPDGDPCCRSKVNMGGDVPHSYYLKEQMGAGFGQDELHTITIEPGKMFNIRCPVQTPGTVIRWQFCTEKHDIQFGVYTSKSTDDLAGNASMTPVQPMTRIMCNTVPHEGAIDCKRPGLYMLVFDNSFSWMNSKTIKYVLDVLKPMSQPDHDLDSNDTNLPEQKVNDLPDLETVCL